ncbi:MAG: dimethylarginine dimethylaminohydrolase family protein [Flavobacteriaceae bacterium]|jgi:N-dimethylarginine dimethylaminohydrolase|tara:strand:- start:21295 stop:22209 length:915 start_codon:yes stop_codon:yes gene_type:complete
MLKLNVNNETSRLLAVVLGTAKSNGLTPKLEECYDPKSRQNVLNNTYPTEIDMINEMNQFEQVLLKYKVDIRRPESINNYNQIFSRDIAFVIDDSFIISNILPDRSNEILAINKVIDLIPKNKLIELPKDCHVEGGDVILHNDYIFIGTYDGDDYSNFKTARTNYKAVKFLKEKFTEKKIIPFDLIKSDLEPIKNALHLDCCLQPVGNGKLVACPEAFLKREQYKWLVDYFGEENILEISLSEMSEMNCNFFSIDTNIVVSEKSFTRLNSWLRSFDIVVEEINYKEISKQGGLLRCSTLPLIRE